MKKPKNLGKTLKPQAGFLRPSNDQKGSPDNGTSVDEELHPPFGKAGGRNKETSRAEIDQEQSKLAGVTGKTLYGRKPEGTHRKNPVNQADDA